MNEIKAAIAELREIAQRVETCQLCGEDTNDLYVIVVENGDGLAMPYDAVCKGCMEKERKKAMEK